MNLSAYEPASGYRLPPDERRANTACTNDADLLDGVAEALAPALLSAINACRLTATGDADTALESAISAIEDAVSGLRWRAGRLRDEA